MIMKKTGFIGILALLCILLSGIAYAGNCGGETPCNCGDTVTSSYTMAGDLDCSGGGSLTIEANSVVLDCAGKSITGDGASDGIVVEGYDSITIKNCNLSGHGNEGEIVIKNSVGNTIINNVFHGNEIDGLYLNYVNSSLIENNIFYGVGEGISLKTGANNIIRKNNISALTAYAGIYLQATGGPVSNNNMTENNLDTSQFYDLNLVDDDVVNNNIWNNNFLGTGIIDEGIDKADNTYCVGGSGNYFRGSAAVINGSCGKLVAAYPSPVATGFDGDTTNFASTDSASVTDLILEKSAYGYIRWEGTVNVDHADFSTYAKIGDHYVSVDTNNLASLDTDAQITIKSVVCPATIYHTSAFFSNAASIIASGTECNSTSTPACTNITCNSGTLTFNVDGFSGYGAQDYEEEGGEGGGVPEFSDYAIIFIVLTAIAGFYVVKVKHK